MRLVVKRWGNGLAFRVPRNHPEIGRVHEGMEFDVEIRATKPARPWKPFTIRSPIPDPSQKIDEIRLGLYDEEIARGHRRH